MPQQGGSDVDRKAVVDQVGREDPSEVVRGECKPFKFGPVFGGRGAGCAQEFCDPAGAEHSAQRPAGMLEKERKRLAVFPLLWSQRRIKGMVPRLSLCRRITSSVAGCWVLTVRRRAPARHHLFVYDVFWLLSFGF